MESTGDEVRSLSRGSNDSSNTSQATELGVVSREGAAKGRGLLATLCSTLDFDIASVYLEDCSSGTMERILFADKLNTAEVVLEEDVYMTRAIDVASRAKQSDKHCYWNHTTIAPPLPSIPGPFLTECAAVLNPDGLEDPENAFLLFIVAFNLTTKIDLQDVKISILEGLGKALFHTIVQLDNNTGPTGLSSHRLSGNLSKILDQENHEKRGSGTHKSPSLLVRVNSLQSPRLYNCDHGRSNIKDKDYPSGLSAPLALPPSVSASASSSSASASSEYGSQSRLNSPLEHPAPKQARSLDVLPSHDSAAEKPSSSSVAPSLSSAALSSPTSSVSVNSAPVAAGLSSSLSTVSGISPAASAPSANSSGFEPLTRRAQSLPLSIPRPAPSKGSRSPSSSTSSSSSQPSDPADDEGGVFMCRPQDVFVMTGVASSPTSYFSFTKTPPLSSNSIGQGQGPGHGGTNGNGQQANGAAKGHAVRPVPSASPMQSFRYRLEELPVFNVIPVGLSLETFRDVKWMVDGSHANLFIANMMTPAGPIKVVVKMLKKESVENPLARREFDVELSILSRVKSPNVVRILGAGKAPRPFMVLEWLAKGTLSSQLSQNQSVSEFFRRPTFTRKALYTNARDLAQCLQFLQEDFNAEACIVHRDIKPDNIGFSADGTIKLMDFGLATCIRQRQQSDEAYEMTGYTGSLRYMSPEVAERRPYTEKVDQYSFALVVWQMATGETPFKGYSREQLLQDVVIEGKRPLCESNKFVPPTLAKLLALCWHRVPELRPSFKDVAAELDRMLKAECGEEGARKELPLSFYWF